MKKVLYLVSLLALTITPNFVSAHMSGESDPAQCSLGIRTEVSKDNGTTWYAYDSSDATSLGTGYTLPVLPGDTIKMRVKIWNEGSMDCLFSATGTTSGFEYLNTSGEIDNLNEDGDIRSFLPIEGNITPLTNAILGGTTATSGYQSVSIDGTVKADAPVGASIGLNYSVTSVMGGMALNDSANKSWARNIIETLIPTAYADDDGTATSGLRMEVSAPVVTAPAAAPAATVTELPKTGQSAYLFLIPVAFILPAYCLIRRKTVSKFSK